MSQKIDEFHRIAESGLPKKHDAGYRLLQTALIPDPSVQGARHE
jgi:hypothetical protein